MGVFRNPELKKQFRYFAAITAVCVFAAWMSVGGVCALYVLGGLRAVQPVRDFIYLPALSRAG